MSVDTVRPKAAEYVEIDDEIDLDGDAYGDNPQASQDYALVEDIEEGWDDDDNPVIVLYTSQGVFSCPSWHKLRVKVA